MYVLKLPVHDKGTLILNHGTRWGSVVISCPAALTQGKRCHYSLNGRLGGPQKRSGRFREEENVCLGRESNHDFSTVKPVA